MVRHPTVNPTKKRAMQIDIDHLVAKHGEVVAEKIATRIRNRITKKQKLRWRLAEEQNYRCCFCQEEMEMVFDYEDRKPPERGVTFEHIIPESQGGATTYQNGLASCSRCNQRRGLTPILSFYEKMQAGFYHQSDQVHPATVGNRRLKNGIIVIRPAGYKRINQLGKGAVKRIRNGNWPESIKTVCPALNSIIQELSAIARCPALIAIKIDFKSMGFKMNRLGPQPFSILELARSHDSMNHGFTLGRF